MDYSSYFTNLPRWVEAKGVMVCIVGAGRAFFLFFFFLFFSLFFFFFFAFFFFFFFIALISALDKTHCAHIA